jgi:hypothetical protein
VYLLQAQIDVSIAALNKTQGVITELSTATIKEQYFQASKIKLINAAMLWEMISRNMDKK